MKLKKNIFMFSSTMFALLAAVIISSIFTGYNFLTTRAATETKEVSQEIKVAAYDSDNRLNNTGVSDPNTLFDNSPYTQYLWEGVNHFKVSQNATGYEDGKYEYHYEIEYTQVRPSSDKPFVSADTKVIKNAFKGEVTNPSKIPAITFYVDHADDTNLYEQLIDNTIQKDTQRNWGGWGTYRFTLFIKGAPKTSMFYYLEPNKITEAPVMDYTIASSITSMNNAYTFSISNYKFVDGTQIKWYVFGEGNDGKLYSLTQEDADLTPTDYKNGLFATIDRTGAEFYFDSNSIAGKWEVYCIVYDQNDPTLELYTTRADAIQVTTGNKMPTSFIIWILVGVGVVLLGVVTFIIVKTTKKEKVW